MTASAEVQKKIYDALVAASISGVTTIRDTPIREPGASDFPFIEIDSSQTIPADTGGGDGLGDDGIEEYVDVHAYSRTGGQKQIKEIMGAIYTALHHTTLTVSGRSSSLCWFDRGRVFDEPDGMTRHGVYTFRVIHRT